MHNKLEKNRRAQLKECYDQLKKELPMKDEDRKKTSNLIILDTAHKYVKVSAKIKIKRQKKDIQMVALYI